MTPGTARVAVLASGAGSNLVALLDHLDSLGAASPAAVVLVASDRAHAKALERAAERGIATAHIADPRDDRALASVLERHGVRVMVLAGYLKFVPDEVTRAFRGRMVNVHPALLPRHGGKGMFGHHVHAAVLAAGDTESGATVHFVDRSYDGGPAIVRAVVPVVRGDTSETLAARVLTAEHFALPRVVAGIAAGEITERDGRVAVQPAARRRFANPPSGVSIRFPDDPQPSTSP